MFKLLQFFGRRKSVPCFRVFFKNAILVGWYFVIYLVRLFQWFIQLLRWENVRVTRWKWRRYPFLNFPDILRQITVILGVIGSPFEIRIQLNSLSVNYSFS